MKKVLIFGVSLILILGVSFLNSCKKEKVQGCMDRDSKNYNPDAEEDDGNCAFEGNVVLWFNQETADSLIDNGVTALTYYVDGAVVGSSAASVYWTSAPNCNQSGSVTILRDLGSVKNKSYSYSVKDQAGDEQFSGVLNFTANTCTATELVW